MSEKIKDTAEAVKGIVEAVPIYEDLLQPTVKELGNGLHTLSKTVHIALTPVSVLVWGYDQIKTYVQASLEQKLKNVPKENIIPPDPSVAGPALEAMRYSGHKEELREMFAKLLATSMNSETASFAHPSFVEIIKQLSSDEARIISLFSDYKSKPILKVLALDKVKDHYAEVLMNFSVLPYLAECEYPEQGPSYLENITRLGLADISYSTYNTTPNAYRPLENHDSVTSLMTKMKDSDKRIKIKRGTIQRNNFGEKFFHSCILEK